VFNNPLSVSNKAASKSEQKQKKNRKKHPDTNGLFFQQSIATGQLLPVKKFFNQFWGRSRNYFYYGFEFSGVQ
jgi:hypothetical protein